MASSHGAGSGMAEQVAASARYYALPVARLMPDASESSTGVQTPLPSGTPAAVRSFLNKGDWRPRTYAEHAALHSGSIGPLQPPARRRLWRYLLRLEPEAFGPVIAPLLGSTGLFQENTLPSAVPPERRALVWSLIKAGVPPELRGWWWCANAGCLKPVAPIAQDSPVASGQQSSSHDMEDSSDGHIASQYSDHLQMAHKWLQAKAGGVALDDQGVPDSFGKSVAQLANDIRRTMQHLPEVALYSVHLRPRDRAIGTDDGAYRAQVRRVSGRADIPGSTLGHSGNSQAERHCDILPNDTLHAGLTGRGGVSPASPPVGSVSGAAHSREQWTQEDFAQRCQLTSTAIDQLVLPALPAGCGLGYFVPPLSQGALEAARRGAGDDSSGMRPRHTPVVIYVHVAVTCCALWRVCLSAALAAPVAGYCQGLNFIAAHALRWMDEPHAAALLGAVASRLRLGGQQYYGNMGPPAADLGVLQGYVEHGCADLVRGALGMRGAPPSTAMVLHTLTGGGLKWLLCLFATPFPPALTSRVWDSYFAGGAAVLFSTTVALLRLSTPWVLAHAKSFPDIVAAVEGIGGGVSAALRAAGEATGEGVHDPQLPLDTPLQDGAEGTSDLAEPGSHSTVELWQHAVLSGRCAELVDWPVLVARTSASQRSLRGGGSTEVAPIYKVTTRPIAGAAPLNLLSLLFEGWWCNSPSRGPTGRMVPPLVDSSAQAVLRVLQGRISPADGMSMSRDSIRHASGDVAAAAAALLPSAPDSHTVSHADQALAAGLLAWGQAHGWGRVFADAYDTAEAAGDGGHGSVGGTRGGLWCALDAAQLLRSPGHTWVATAASVPHHDVRLTATDSTSDSVPSGAPSRLWQPHVLVTAPTTAHLLRFILPPLFRGGLTDEVIDAVLLQQTFDSESAAAPGCAWWVADPPDTAAAADQRGGVSQAAEAGASAAQAALQASLDREKRELGPGTPTGAASELTRAQRSRGITASAVLSGAGAGSARLTGWFMLQAMLRHSSGPSMTPSHKQVVHPILQRAVATRQLLSALGQWAAYTPIDQEGHAGQADEVKAQSGVLPMLALDGGAAGAGDAEAVVDPWQGTDRLPAVAGGSQAPLGWPSALLVAAYSAFNGDVLHASRRAAGAGAHPALLLAMGIPLPPPPSDAAEGGDIQPIRQAAPLSPPLGAPQLDLMPPQAPTPSADLAEDAASEQPPPQAQYLGGDSHTFHLPALTVLPLQSVQGVFCPPHTKRKHPFAFEVAGRLSSWWPMHGAPEGPHGDHGQAAGNSCSAEVQDLNPAESTRRASLGSPGLVLSSDASAGPSAVLHQSPAGSTPVTPLFKAAHGAQSSHAHGQVRMYSSAVAGTCEFAFDASPLLWHVLAGALGASHAPYTTTSLMLPGSNTAIKMRQDAGTVQVVSVGEEQLFRLARGRRGSTDQSIDARSIGGAPEEKVAAQAGGGFLSRVFRWGNKTKAGSSSSTDKQTLQPATASASGATAATRASASRTSLAASMPVWGDKARLVRCSVQHQSSVAFEVPMHSAAPGVQWLPEESAAGSKPTLSHAAALASSHPTRIIASLPVPFSACSMGSSSSASRATRKSITVPPGPPPKDMMLYVHGGAWGIWALFPSLQWLEGAYGVLCTPPSPEPVEPPRRLAGGRSSSQDTTPVAHPHGHGMALVRRGAQSVSAASTPVRDLQAAAAGRTPGSGHRSAGGSLAVVAEGTAEKRLAGRAPGKHAPLEFAASVSLSSALDMGRRVGGLEGLARAEVDLGALQAQRRIRWSAEAATQWNARNSTETMNYPEFCQAYGAVPLTALSGEERLLLLPAEAPDADLLWHQSQEGDPDDENGMIASLTSPPLEGGSFPADSEVEDAGDDEGEAANQGGPSSRKPPSMRRSAEVRPLNKLQRIMPGRGGSIRRFALVSRRAGSSGAPPPVKPCQRVYAVWFSERDLAAPLGAVPHPSDGRTPLNMRAQEEGALMLHLAEDAPALLIEGYFRRGVHSDARNHKPSSPATAPHGQVTTDPGSAQGARRLTRGARVASDAHVYTPHAHLMGHKRKSPRSSQCPSLAEGGHDGDSSSVGTTQTSSATTSPTASPKPALHSASDRKAARAPSSRRQALGGVKGGLAAASTSTRNALRSSIDDHAVAGVGFLGSRCPQHLAEAARDGAGVLPLPLALEAPAQSVHAAMRVSLESGQGGILPVDLSPHDAGEAVASRAGAGAAPVSIARMSGDAALSFLPTTGGSGSAREAHDSLGRVMTLQLAQLAADDDSSDDEQSAPPSSPPGDSSRRLSEVSVGDSLALEGRGFSVVSLADALQPALVSASQPGAATQPASAPLSPDEPRRRTKRAVTTSARGTPGPSPAETSVASSSKNGCSCTLMQALLAGMSGEYTSSPVLLEGYFCEISTEEAT